MLMRSVRWILRACYALFVEARIHEGHDLSFVYEMRHATSGQFFLRASVVSFSRVTTTPRIWGKLPACLHQASVHMHCRQDLSFACDMRGSLVAHSGPSHKSRTTGMATKELLSLGMRLFGKAS